MTFKANWEKTHTKVHLPEELLLKMLEHYYNLQNQQAAPSLPQTSTKNITVIAGGCANINVLVHINNANDPVILRVYLRDKESAYREQKISALLKGKLPVAEFYYVGEVAGYTFAITEYLPGITLRDFLLRDKENNISANSKIMFEVGKALGAIASITFPSAGFFKQNLTIKENLTQDSLVHFCLESLKDSKVIAIISAEQRAQIASIFNVYKNLLPDENEKNLVHADFDPANILVIENHGKVEISAILDWEFSFSGSTLCDIANMLRYAHQMPDAYKHQFLDGLLATGYQLPKSWQPTINMLNILALLDCVRRSDPKNSPNQMQDIQELISHILNNFKKVEVVPYDPNWPKLFATEANRIKTALGNNFVAIHHVGSTAVPELAAKPKIDIITCVKDICFNYQNLIDLNYTYRGALNLPFRKSFTYRSPNLNVNLHVFEQDDPEVELNLSFRDYLRTHPQDRDEYTALKYILLADNSSHKQDGNIYKGYTLGKQDLIHDVLQKTGFDRVRFTICTHHREWDAAKNFRNKYFFGPHNIADPYTWTFTHKDHKHLILYKGVAIIGYAHVQLWPGNRAALRIIAIEQKHRNKNHGKEFMTLIEKWLQLEGYKSIHIESSPAALKFYQQLNYKEMPFNDPDGYEGGSEDIAIGKLL